MNGIRKPQVNALFDAILTLKDREACYRFFEDICTVREIQDMAQRLDVARELSRGKNYGEVSASTGASSATICRVNKCLLYGAGGYREVISRMDGEEKQDGDGD